MAAGITIKLGKAPRLRSKGFSDEEAHRILAAALNHKQANEGRRTFAAKRWVPWLCALTGARVGEVAQLRKEDVRHVGGYWTLHITPEAGTVKTNEARDVVLHPQLLELGFLEFTKSAGDRHLFVTPAADGDIRGPLRGLKNRLAEFARKVVSDPNVAPNHGWCHRFKTIAIENDVPERVIDAIQGHAARSVGQQYGDVTIKAQANAISKIPYYSVKHSQ